MADENDTGEKTEEPSQSRIDEFRKRGEVASSKELNSVLVLSASILTLALTLVYTYETLSNFVHWLYALDIEAAYTEKSLNTIFTHVSTVALKSVGPLFGVVVFVGILANVMQIGFLFSPEVLQWKPERIDPVQGAKKLFSMKSVMEAFKGVCKFIFIMAIVYFFIRDDLAKYGGFYHMDFFPAFMHGKWMIIRLAFSIVVGLLLVALMDFAYQKYTYKQKLRMTKDQSKRESKEKDGNPEVKQRIRSIQREMSQKRLMSEIPDADVIVTNPTHLSIVIKYDSMEMISPMVLGKGADSLALRIREVAKEHNVPIVENVPLARALYSTVKEGAPIPRSLYKAVAEVLAFVYKLKKKRKAQGQSRQASL